VRFEVLVAGSVKITVFRHVALTQFSGKESEIVLWVWRKQIRLKCCKRPTIFWVYVGRRWMRTEKWYWNTSNMLKNNENIIFSVHYLLTKSRDSAVGIVIGNWLETRGIGGRVQVGSRIFTSSCLPDLPWGPPNVYPMDKWVSFPGGKATEVWSWPLTSN
jgi:hypothetical protein